MYFFFPSRGGGGGGGGGELPAYIGFRNRIVKFHFAGAAALGGGAVIACGCPSVPRTLNGTASRPFASTIAATSGCSRASSCANSEENVNMPSHWRLLSRPT